MAFLHQERGESIAGRPIGIDIAIRGLLHGWLKYGQSQERLCCARTETDFAGFLRHADHLGIDPATCRAVSMQEVTAGAADCVFTPDPAIAPLAWTRQAGAHTPFSLCGIAHGMSGEAVAAQVGQCVVAPTCDYDAIICPSRAVRSVIENLWEGWSDYLHWRAGGRMRCPVQLPVIPLGIDYSRFAALKTADARAALRHALGITEDEVVVLFIGRLSFVSKAHPLPLLAAMEEVSRQATVPVRLIFQGFFYPSSAETDFRRLAEALCQSAKVDFIADDDPRFPDRLWGAADIFVSLADNVQESFGLTPVEAMASGLAVVASDWDGYRDTIRDGVDGIQIPTTAPPPGAGAVLAERYHWGEDSYGNHLAAAAQSTAVSVPALTEALSRLVASSDLRRQMAHSGQQRARATFDWPAVIAAYEDLWRELAERRHAAAPGAPPHPHYLDPFSTFGQYPSTHLSVHTRLACGPNLGSMHTLFDHRMNLYLPDLLLSPERSLTLLITVQKMPGVTIGELAQGMKEPDLPALMRTVGWLVKLDLCRCQD